MLSAIIGDIVGSRFEWNNHMRVSACDFICKDLKEVKKLSKAVTEVTHNHPEGLKGQKQLLFVYT